MLIKLNQVFCGLLTILFAINIYLYAQSVVIGDQVNKTEKEIKVIKNINQDLTKQIYSINSLASLEEMAKVMGFTKKAEPIFLEGLKVAQAK